MEKHHLKVYPAKEQLPREKQLAWKMADVALDPVKVEPEAVEMIGNRIIDNASVAIAAANRPAVKNARLQALAHPRTGGAAVFGLPSEKTVCAEWAAWANGTAVRELDFHDTYLAADYSHPGDNIPPVLAVVQQCDKNGNDLVNALAVSYELHINLVKAICLHEFKKDHIAHLCPASAAGIANLLNLNMEQTYHSINQAVHVSFSTRQSRKGDISTWKAYAPAHSGKLAVEAVDRCMRGEGAPNPIYEGEDSVLSWMLGGKKSEYYVPMPNKGESKKAILESYTKEHSAEYQAQALIDLAFRMRKKITNFDDIESIVIHTSHHTHYVIGTGAGDPQKMDPNASRETLDHSIMYIFTVALQDGKWHHVDSYSRERATREDTVKLWHKISTVEDPSWTKKYHDPDPDTKAFGGKVEITFKNGEKLIDELGIANAHPAGARPFTRNEYVEKFKTLTNDLISPEESKRFLNLINNIQKLSSDDIKKLNVTMKPDLITAAEANNAGIF